MIDRSNFILALLPPAMAVSWVVADATTGLVAADHAAVATAPDVQIVSSQPTVPAALPQHVSGPVIVCAAPGAKALALNLHGRQLVTIQRLCRASLNFAAGFPNG